MFPQFGHRNRDPYLCTYYAFTALLVVSLTIRLLWNPSIQLITEINTVITRAVIYFNTEILGYSNTDFFTSLETAFLNEGTLLGITFLCTSFILYLASSDIINFAASYVASLRINEALEKVKMFAFSIFEEVFSSVGKKKTVTFKPKIDDRHNRR